MTASGTDRPLPAGTGYAAGLAIGVGAGVAVGTALGTPALGVAVGAGIGVALGVAFERGREAEPLTPGQRRLLVFAVVLGRLAGLAVLVLAWLG